MHCLVVTIFTVLITILQVLLLFLTMVYNEFCYIIFAKNSLLCISDQLSISASFQIMNIGYQKTEKFDFGTPLVSIIHMYSTFMYVLQYDKNHRNSNITTKYA